MAERAAWIRLERDAGIDDGEWLAERWNHTRYVGAATEDLKETPFAIETLVAGREAARRELRRDDAVLGGAPGVQRLGHRAEADADAARRAGRDPERVGDCGSRQ